VVGHHAGARRDEPVGGRRDLRAGQPGLGAELVDARRPDPGGEDDGRGCTIAKSRYGITPLTKRSALPNRTPSSYSVTPSR
jgi:hypothetical protein